MATATSCSSKDVKNIGIKGISTFIPKHYVSQTKLESFNNVSPGKYTIGLGQTNMAITPLNIDINSICLSVLNSLMKDYNIDYKDIGFLEVGTETIIDKSKSIKTTLMSLFIQHGNHDVVGIDVKNACYGGTAALFNALQWVESSYWDGKYALVICADLAVYADGSARPTGGAGAVAMLIGRDANIVFDTIRATYMTDVYDFYKPDMKRCV